MIRKRSLWAAASASMVLSLSLAAALPSDAAPDKDPAARGLDMFVHAPHQGAPRGILPLQIEAFGFPAVTTLLPLAGATIEALWDPTSLGPNVSVAPPAVRGVTDASGRVHLDVPIPDGDDRTLSLLIGVRSGEHERTRAIEVQRIRPHDVTLYVTEREVVPGGETTAWVRVTSVRTEEPVANTPVELTLSEGPVARKTFRLTTDVAGMAMARVPVPKIDASTWALDLTARGTAQGQLSDSERVTLVPREETPGSPRIVASFSETSIKAGDRVKWTARVRDATDQPIAGLPVRTWIGPLGTTPPKDPKAWEKFSTLATTDPSGQIEGEVTAPSTVVQGKGTALTLVAKTKVDGQALEESSRVSVGVPLASAELLPEAGAIVPGLEQRMLVRVLDGHQNPVASAPLSIEGDGLKARVVTDAHGEAEVVWSPPIDLGAFRNVGPCAGGVAAAVIVRTTESVPALAERREPFELCVPVDRDASAIARADAPLARGGDRVHVRVQSAKGQPKGPWSVLLGTGSMALTSSMWIEDGEKGGSIELPGGASGVWVINAVSPSSNRKARVSGGALLVTPPVLPKLTAKVTGGRAAPRGTIEIDAEMSDGRGGALPGTVAAVVVDLHGGGSVAALESLDTRLSLCHRVSADPSRCDKLLEGDASATPLLRSLLARAGGTAAGPDFDPGGTAREELTKTFGEVLRSLEGALFEAAQSPERLRDVGRKGPDGWTFNPELMTLVTAAMDPAPETPGGEKLTLADLFAVDRQVTFDNVARRITRLKLFRILSDVRAFRRERLLDPDEPALKDPNAILRKLVRDGRLPQEMLLDPWGGTIQFAKSGGPPIPFLSVARGFELRAPGPDRQLGTGDDVRDPFERVLASGTPYADAVSEDRIVDARVEMEVGDATVGAWESMFNELTGTALGGGLGLSGVGEGGGGRGEGIGLGSIGTIGHGSGRYSRGVPTGIAFWSKPLRTDASGKVKIRVPLGDIETTWRIALVGVPDRARPATTTLDVPVSLPLSARVDAGATWVEGDDVDVAVSLRNRTGAQVRASLFVEAGGVAEIAYGKTLKPVIDVPAGGVRVVKIRVKAPRAGAASMRITTRAPGIPEDVVNHAWDVLPAGDPVVAASARWVEKETELRLSLDERAYRVNGPPRVVLEHGYEPAIAAALDALDPDALGSPEALADAIEVASRVERWATSRSGQAAPLAHRSADIAKRAIGRMLTWKGDRSGPSWTSYGASPVIRWASERRAISFGPASYVGLLGEPAECPPGSGTDIDAAAAGIEAEPPPSSGVVKSCWDAFVTTATSAITQSGDPVALARAVIALAERPHRAAMAASLADRLRERVSLLPSGAIALPEVASEDREARSIVFAALLRGGRLGKASPATQERIAAWLRVQRDSQGGYGSPRATRAVVSALLWSIPDIATKATVVVVADGVRREVEVGPSAEVSVPLDPRVKSATVEVRGAPVLARFEQPVLRLWSRPPQASESALKLETEWPPAWKTWHKTAPLRVILRHDLRRSLVAETRIPLPPGVSLAVNMNNVRQMQGVLAIRTPLNSSSLPTVLEIPLRFSLSGRVTAPESRARIALEESPAAIAPARPVLFE